MGLNSNTGIYKSVSGGEESPRASRQNKRYNVVSLQGTDRVHVCMVWPPPPWQTGQPLTKVTTLACGSSLVSEKVFFLFSLWCGCIAIASRNMDLNRSSSSLSGTDSTSSLILVSLIKEEALTVSFYMNDPDGWPIAKLDLQATLILNLQT